MTYSSKDTYNIIFYNIRAHKYNYDCAFRRELFIN